MMSFSNLVFKLSRMLVKDDLEAITYLYKLPVDTSAGNSATGLSYMKELEKNNVFSSSNLNGLRELLNNIQRCDLIEMVDDFEKERLQKNSTRHQPCVRPQEESVRLNISYSQAKKTEEELLEFQKELIAFCSKNGGSPDVRQFYTGMLKRLKDIRDSCHRFITVPLHEIIHSSYPTPTQFARQNHGGRQMQYYESQNHPRPGGVVTTASPAIGHGQRRPDTDRLIPTQGQASHSLPPTRMIPPMRGNLAATWNHLPQPPPSISLPELRGADIDYDTLSPMDTNGPKVQRDGAHNGFAASKGNSRSVEKLTTIHHDQARAPKMSKSRGHNDWTQRAVGQQQNSRIRLSNGQSSSSSIPIPSLKRTNSADDLLNEKPRSCLSRIPKLTSSPKHHAYGRQLMLGLGAQTSSRDSSDYSGGSCYSDCDFTGSTDSGVDVRETSSLRAMARFGRHPSLDLSPPLGTSRGEEEYAQLNKSTMEASSVYQKPQVSLHT